MTSNRTSNFDVIARGHLEEIFAAEIEECNMLFKACQYGQGYHKAPDDRVLVDHLVGAWCMLPIELTGNTTEADEAIFWLDNNELRSFQIDVGRHLAEQVRQTGKGYQLTDSGGAYWELRRWLDRPTHHFGYQEVGFTRKEWLDLDLEECTVADSMIDFDTDFDDRALLDWGDY